MPLPIAGVLAGMCRFFTDGLAGKAAVDAVASHTVGVAAGTFGAGAMTYAAYDAKNATPDKAANYGGAGYDLDSTMLAQKAAEEDRQINEDKQKIAHKMSQPKGILDPTHKSWAIEEILA